MKATHSVNPSVKKFRAVAEAYFEESFERFPTYGSAVGRKEFYPELDKPDHKTYAAHEKLLRKTLGAVQDLPESDFAHDDWLDRRALLSELRTELWAIERGMHRRNPEHWASGAIGSIHSLVVKKADN